MRPLLLAAAAALLLLMPDVGKAQQICLPNGQCYEQNGFGIFAGIGFGCFRPPFIQPPAQPPINIPIDIQLPIQLPIGGGNGGYFPGFPIGGQGLPIPSPGVICIPGYGCMPFTNGFSGPGFPVAGGFGGGLPAPYPYPQPGVLPIGGAGVPFYGSPYGGQMPYGGGVYGGGFPQYGGGSFGGGQYGGCQPGYGSWGAPQGGSLPPAPGGGVYIGGNQGGYGGMPYGGFGQYGGGGLAGSLYGNQIARYVQRMGLDVKRVE